MNIINFFYKLLPKSKRQLIMYHVSKRAYEILYKDLPNPRIFLQERQLQNCRFIESEAKMFKTIPDAGLAVYIGEPRKVAEILSYNRPRKLVIVTDRNKELLNENMFNEQFRYELEAGELELMNIEDLPHLPAASLDWAYLDSHGKFEQIKFILNVLRTKLKLNGFIAGNKYVTGEWKQWIKYDTIEAVNGFCLEHDYELLYLVQAPAINYSFLLRRASSGLTPTSE